MNRSVNHPPARAAGRNLKMQTVPLIAGLLLSITGLLPGQRLAAQEGGVALSIIYDTSGSMKDPVPNKEGKLTPKYVIANRALIAIAKQIDAFATQKVGLPRKV